MKEEGKAVHHVIIDMIKTQRCFDIPVAIEFEVVRRNSAMKMVGGERKSACVKPYGAQSDDCLWLEKEDIVPTK